MDNSSESDAVEPMPDFHRLCRHLSERSPMPMIAVEGANHVVSYLNPAFARLVREPVEALVGRPFAEAVQEAAGNGCLALLDCVSRTGCPEHLADQEHHGTDPPTYWSYSAWAIAGDRERPAGVMIQVTDSTQTVLARSLARDMNEALMISSVRQHELVEVAESLGARLQAGVRSRDHFLAALSHELRNPLAPLSAGLQLLKRSGTTPDVAETCRAMMERQLKQLVRLVDDLLDVTRITTGKLEISKERVDLATVVRDAVEASRPLIDKQGHALTVILPIGPIILDADPTRLTQVLLNLLNNAAKYSEPCGHIHLTAARDGGEVVVSVRDSGIGIAAGDLPHLFEAFMQVDSSWGRAQGGLGIGLSLVREFVALHGGRVEAHSDGPGKGSEFVVRLPGTLAERQPTPAKQPTAAEEPGETEARRGSRRRVLVVDDNTDAADLLATLLTSYGHDVNTAYDGIEALAIAERFHPEVILMDLGMPKLDGYEAARHIRAKPWGAAPFLVAVTGRNGDDEQHRTHAAGFDHYLVKPADPDALARIVAEMSVAWGDDRS